MKSPATLVSLLVVAALLPVQAANWPEWRGPEGNHVTPEKNLPTEWSETKNIRWRAALPDRGNSSPIVWGDRVFVTQAIEKDNRRTLMAFDRKNGKLLWQSGTVFNEKEETHPDNPYCAASPVTDGKVIVATFGSAGVFCYDFNGQELWKRDLGPQIHTWGNASSPVLSGDLVILFHGPGPNSQLLAMNKTTGATVWKVMLPEPVPGERTDGFSGKGPGVVGTFSTPTFVRAGQREELIMSLPQVLKAFDPRTGRELWSCDGLNPLIYSSVIHGEGLVVAMGGFFGGTMAVRPGGSGDVTQTHRIWHEQRSKKSRIGSGVVFEGHIYVQNQDGIAECLELRTGRTVWTERLRGAGAKTDSWSSLVRSGDRLYAVNQSGDVFVLKASPKFELIASNPVGEPSNSSLAVSNGELFLRTHQSLWCIRDSKQTAFIR